MRRRYGYYWTKLIGATLALTAWVLAFVWLGDSWLQLISAGVLGVLMTQIAFLGHDAAHRQMFKSGRWNDWISLIVATFSSASATAGGRASTPGTTPGRTPKGPIPTSRSAPSR
jgi:fatty acid desaturase